MRHYTQLTSGQRYQISALLKTSQSLTKIAEVIGVHKSTVSREIQRNKGLRGYRPNQAQQLAIKRQLPWPVDLIKSGTLNLISDNKDKITVQFNDCLTDPTITANYL